MDTLEYEVRNRSIRSERELRRRFHRLAAELHPDTGRAGASDEAFWQLRSDYEAALLLLKHGAHDTPGPPWDACACIDAFADLVASNFPIGPAVDPWPRGYAAARKRFADLYGHTPERAELFSTFERELYAIRGDNIIWNPLFGKIKLILINIPGLVSPGAFSGRAVTKWLADLESQSAEWDLDDAAKAALDDHAHVVPFLRSMVKTAEECGNAGPG